NSTLPLTRADVVFSGTVTVGDVWTVTLNGNPYVYTTITTSLDDVAAGLNTAIGTVAGVSVAASGSTLGFTATGSNSFTLAVKESGQTADGVAKFTNVATRAAYQQADVALSGTVTAGNTWTLSLRDQAGIATDYTFTATTNSLADVAAGLVSTLNTTKPGTATYAATQYGQVVRITDTGTGKFFTASIASSGTGSGTVNGIAVQTAAQDVKWTNAALVLTGTFRAGDTYAVTVNAGTASAYTATYVAGAVGTAGTTGTTTAYAATLDGVALALRDAINNKAPAGKTYAATASGSMLTIADPAGVTLTYGVSGAASAGTLASANAWTKSLAFANPVPGDAGRIYTVAVDNVYFNATADATPTAAEILAALSTAINANASYAATYDTDATRGSGVLTIAKKDRSAIVARLEQGSLSAPSAAVANAAKVVKIGTPTADQVHTLILKETSIGTVRAFTYHADASPTAAEVATGLAAAVNAGSATHKFAVSRSADVADTLLITNTDGLAFTADTTRGSTSVVSGTSAYTYRLSGTVTAGEVYSVTLVPASGSASVFAFEAATTAIDDVLAGLAAAVNTAGSGYTATARTASDTLTIVNNAGATFSVGTTRGTAAADAGAASARLSGAVSIGDVFTVALNRGASTEYYSYAATTTSIDDVLTGLKTTIGTTNYAVTADATSGTLTVVRNSAGALTMSVDRGTAKDISSWASSISVGGTGIANSDTVTVRVAYGSGPTTKDYAVTVSGITGDMTDAQRQQTVAGLIATAINSDSAALFYADVESGSAVVNVFSAAKVDATTAIASVTKQASSASITLAPVTNATQSVQVTGTAAAGKVWTIGLPNPTAGTDYYSFAATTANLADVVTGLVAAINAATATSGFSAVDSSHNGATVPSLTITRSSATAFTASLANPAASLADASGWTETLKLAGTVATNTAWVLSAKSGATYATFGYAATGSDTTLASVASGLAGAVTGANYRALDTGNDTVTLFRIDRATTTVSTTAPAAALGDAATWTETLRLGGTPTEGMVYAVGTKDDAMTPAYDTYSVIAGSTDTLTNLTTSLTAALNASATYDAIATGNNTITILSGADTNAFSALTTLGANPSDAAAWSEAVQVSGTVATGKIYTVALTTASGAPTYFNYTASATDTLDSVTAALSGLIDASSGYATLVTGASGSKVIHVLQQGGTTGIASSTSLAAPASDAAAYAETVEVGGTVVARETWNITLTPSSGSPVTFSYAAGSGADTADAQTVAQRLAAQIDANGSYNATAFQSVAGTWVVAISAQGGTGGFTATQSVSAAAPLVRPTLGGEAKVAWTQQVTLADGAGVDDVWTVRLDGTSGLSNYQLTGTTATSATAAAALASSIGYVNLDTTTTGNVAKFRQDNSNFVTIGQRTWIDRLAPTATTAPAADSVAASARLTEYNFTL
ncbi:MAG: hypothetical protein IOC39_37005, partial [Burkholderia sp.]|uniref:beta strand repeat-containing protein n=1 Tax=Burkholderia sp. TaxID=36773 RepID=UPI002587D883